MARVLDNAVGWVRSNASSRYVGEMCLTDEETEKTMGWQLTQRALPILQDRLAFPFRKPTLIAYDSEGKPIAAVDPLTMTLQTATMEHNQLKWKDMVRAPMGSHCVLLICGQDVDLGPVFWRPQDGILSQVARNLPA